MKAFLDLFGIMLNFGIWFVGAAQQTQVGH